MRKMKKYVAALVLALFSLTMAVPAFAVVTGESFNKRHEGGSANAFGETITLNITNSIKGASIDGQTFDVYKIFDAEKKTTTVNQSYTYSGTDPEVQALLEKFKAQGNHNVEWIKTKGAEEVQKLYKAGKFGEKVGTATASGETASIKLTDGITENHGGFYMIIGKTVANGVATHTDPMFITAVATNAEADTAYTVKVKSEAPTIDKVITNNTDALNIGDKVEYKVTGKVPNISAYTDGYIYKITDTMSAGLTPTAPFDIAVQIGAKTLDKGDYTLIEPSEGKNGFELTLNLTELAAAGKANIGDAINVTYSATINDKSITDSAKNEVKLSYSNDPSNCGQGGTTSDTTITDENTAKPYTFGIDMKLTYAGSQDFTEPFEFKLKNEQGQYFKKEANKVSWVASADEATVVTIDSKTDNTDNIFNGIGLVEGPTKYTIEEVSVPAEFENLGNSDIYVRPVYKDDTKKVVTAIEYCKDNQFGPDKQTVNIPADKTHGVLTEAREYGDSSFLPETGSIGTTIFFIGGALLMGTAVLLRRRKIDEN